jgi:hypothetical protein
LTSSTASPAGRAFVATWPSEQLEAPDYASLDSVTDAEIERAIRRAGYDIRWEAAPDGSARAVFAVRDGKRHTRSHATLLGLAQHLGRIQRPVEFVEDRDAVEKAMSKHAEEPHPFVVQLESCRTALFRLQKYVQLVSAAGNARAMYELQGDRVRRTSKGNLPPEVVAAFAIVTAGHHRTQQ